MLLNQIKNTNALSKKDKDILEKNMRRITNIQQKKLQQFFLYEKIKEAQGEKSFFLIESLYKQYIKKIININEKLNKDLYK